jgi:hypothetical protein
MITGKIFKLVCNTKGLFYIGSTTQPLCKRLTNMKTQQYKTNRAMQIIITRKNYEIILIEENEFKSKEELKAKEKELIHKIVFIDKNEKCLNGNYEISRKGEIIYNAFRAPKLNKEDKFYNDPMIRRVFNKYSCFYLWGGPFDHIELCKFFIEQIEKGVKFNDINFNTFNRKYICPKGDTEETKYIYDKLVFYINMKKPTNI